MKTNQHYRRYAFTFSAVLLMFACLPLYARSAKKPNVVLMLADNVGYGDIGAFQGGEIRGMPTPRIDRLASEGLTLTQFITEPGCTPSRAGLITGRYAHRSGLGSIIVAGTPNTLLDEEITLAEIFKSQGYVTAMTGKWHLGAEKQSLPVNQGFDEYRVGVLETTDSTLYRPNMTRAGLPEAVINAAAPKIWEGDSKNGLKPVREYTVEYRKQVEGDIAKPSKSNGMVSIHDFLPTLATIIGADIPNDRAIDGIDQTDFFLGKQKNSNRNSILTFLGDEIVAVRWRHFRIYPKQFIETEGIPPMTGIFGARTETTGYPIIINLFADHKEELNIAADHAFVIGPYMKAIAAYKKSLVKDPNPPAFSLTEF